MRPVQHFRLWLRSGPAAERAVAAIAGSVTLALLLWVVVPAATGPTRSSSAAGTAFSEGAFLGDTTSAGDVRPGSPDPTGRAATQTGSGTTDGARAGAGGRSPSGLPPTLIPNESPTTRTTAAACPAGSTAPGISATQVLVGVVLVDIGALNSAIGIPTIEEHKAAYKAVLDDINARGGVHCRKVVAKFYVENVTDASTAQAACLQMQEDKVFAVLNNLHNPQAITCVAQAKIPNIWYTPPHNPTLTKYAPYVLSYMPDYERLVKNYVRALQAVGWFKGVGKVGILQGSCYPYLNTAIRRELTGIGLPESTWSAYDYGCPTTSLAAPEKDTQAAVQFNREGVTHVLSVQYLQSPNFATAAEQQQYRPKYAVMSDGQVSASDKAAQAPPSSFDGALAITMDQIGAQHTAGITHSAATERCRKLIMGAGLKDPVGDGSGVAGGLYGVACVNTTMLVAALTKAPSLTREAFATGLSRVGALDLSFPAGPSVFDSARVPTGGQFWRVLAFEVDCNCWRVSKKQWSKQFV